RPHPENRPRLLRSVSVPSEPSADHRTRVRPHPQRRSLRGPAAGMSPHHLRRPTREAGRTAGDASAARDRDPPTKRSVPGARIPLRRSRGVLMLPYAIVGLVIVLAVAACSVQRGSTTLRPRLLRTGVASMVAV